jgi:hypothetical protein
MSEINGFPPLTVEQFYAIPNGTRVVNYGADQCVALANLYHVSVMGGTLTGTYINSAFQWWTDFEKYPQLTNVYTKVPVSEPAKRGDIFVTERSNRYDPVHGHIGVVQTDWNGTTFGTMEQNAGSGSARWVYRYNRITANIYGYLRPKNNVSTFGDEELKLIWSDPAQGGDGSIALVGEFTFTPVGNMDKVKAFSKAFGEYSALSREEYLFNAEQVAVRKNEFAGSFSINVDAIAQAVADKIDCGGSATPCVTTKADILESIEANYPEDM